MATLVSTAKRDTDHSKDSYEDKQSHREVRLVGFGLNIRVASLIYLQHAQTGNNVHEGCICKKKICVGMLTHTHRACLRFKNQMFSKFKKLSVLMQIYVCCNFYNPPNPFTLFYPTPSKNADTGQNL